MRYTARILSGTLALASVALLLIGSLPAQAQTVLNGSFETNTASGSQFNLTNTALTATVSNVTGFGPADEVDLITGTDLGIAPIFGNWKVQLHTTFTGLVDAFSFALSQPLVAGRSYTLSFYAARADITPFDVEVGISSSATSFGTLIFSGAPTADGEWTNLGTTFVAPSAGSFLTVRSGPLLENLIYVDNFTLAVAGPEPGTLALGVVGLGIGRGIVARRRKR